MKPHEHAPQPSHIGWAKEEAKLRALVEKVLPEVLSRQKPELEEWVKTVANKHAQRLMNLPLTITQVASLLNVTPKTIYNWKAKGHLVFHNISGRYVITLHELNDQIKAYRMPMI